jgi:chemotaxis protein MotA
MQKSTILGLLSGFGLVFGAIFLGTGWQQFLSIPSLLLVIGGTASALVVSYSFAEVQELPDALTAFLNYEAPRLSALVDQFTTLSRTARRDGLLALDQQLDTIDNDLTRLGLELAIDGSEEDEIKEMLDRKSDGLTQQKRLLTGFFNSAGTFAPAFGMVGTLIGLIQMLQNLDDPTQIGSGMATALITTFYGALLANLVLLPIAQKAQSQLDSILRSHELVRAGILAIVRGERPSLIQRRLSVFIRQDTAGADEVDVEADDAAADEPLSRAA